MFNFFAKYCSLYKVWDKDSITQWKQKKQAGIIKFILIEGVIKWGLLSTLIFFSLAFHGREIGQREALTTCLIWFLGAIVYGSFLWYGTSLAYKEDVKRNNKSQRT